MRLRLVSLLAVTPLACAPSEPYDEAQFLTDYVAAFCDAEQVCSVPVAGGQSVNDCRWSVRNHAEYELATGGHYNETNARACVAVARERAAGDCDREVRCWSAAD